MANDIIRDRDLVDNPDPRVAVCFCLDTSKSMRSKMNGKTRVEIMQTALKEMYQDIYDDDDARYAAEFCIVTFDDTAKKLQDFSRVEYENKLETPPQLVADGMTAMGDGLNMALDLLDERKREYKSRGVDYYQPWLVLITDGEDNGDPASMMRAKERIHELVADKKLCLYPFHIGKSNGLEALQALTPDQPALNISANQLRSMFRWLKKSVSKVSCSRIGTYNEIRLDAAEVSQWNDLLL